MVQSWEADHEKFHMITDVHVQEGTKYRGALSRYKYFNTFSHRLQRNHMIIFIPRPSNTYYNRLFNSMSLTNYNGLNHSFKWSWLSDLVQHPEHLIKPWTLCKMTRTPMPHVLAEQVTPRSNPIHSYPIKYSSFKSVKLDKGIMSHCHPTGSTFVAGGEWLGLKLRE